MDRFWVIVNQWFDDMLRFLPTLLFIALILLLMIIISRRTQWFVQRLSGRTKAPPEIGELLGRVGRIAVLVVGTLLILGRLGLGDAVISFVAGLGIVGIVIGFALQDIVKQFAAGVLLLMLRPIRIGDEVKIGNFKGKVMEIQLRATVLKTADGDEVLIPNADVYTTPIVNESRYRVRRRVVTLKVARTIDLERVRFELQQALEKLPGVVDDPPPSVVGIEVDENVVKIELRFWVDERKNNPDALATDAIAAARRLLGRAMTVEDQGGDSQESNTKKGGV